MTALSADPLAGAPTPAVGYVGRIPVRNLWLLMLYASELFRSGGVAKVDPERAPDDLPDLIAELLSRAVEARMRRRLSLGYRARDAVLTRVRGRIDGLITERRRLLDRGRVACRFEELALDTPRNRYVRAALETASRIVRRSDVMHRCRSLATSLRALGVAGPAPSRAEASADCFGRHDADDRFMVMAARLLFELALPTETAGAQALVSPEREEVWVRRLFERAIGGFYDVVLGPQGWQVRRGSPLCWQIDRQTVGIDKILPNMKTDIVLDHPASGRRIVIDTKFTSIVTPGWHRDETLRSGYIYQLYAYLHSQTGGGDAAADGACGLLLHPAIHAAVDESVVIQGRTLRFGTVDLTASTADIREQLLQFCRPDPRLSGT